MNTILNSSKVPSYILLTEKSWHTALFLHLRKRCNESWHIITAKKDFTVSEIEKINPEKIFIPHWSYIISAEIFERFECVVFHMTDLPYGRGGSPLQNLIVRGKKDTLISALRVNKGIDTGDIFLKKAMSLNGTATEIFLRTVPIIQEMIEEIIDENLHPYPQEGSIVSFKRRTPNESDISKLGELSEVFDYIRMLDAENYPKAFLETEFLKIEFSNANYNNREIFANVRITKK